MLKCSWSGGRPFLPYLSSLDKKVPSKLANAESPIFPFSRTGDRSKQIGTMPSCQLVLEVGCFHLTDLPKVFDVRSHRDSIDAHVKLVLVGKFAMILKRGVLFNVKKTLKSYLDLVFIIRQV